MSLSVILILNAVILISVLSVTNVLRKSSFSKNKRVQSIFGLLFGLAGILLMNLTWGASTGVFYDSRTILISVVSVLYSPIATFIAVVITSIYRGFQGGIGTVAGIITIVGTASLGLLMKYFVFNKMKKINIFIIYMYGIVIHLFMLLYHFALPSEIDFIIERIRLIAPVILGLYPLVVVIIFFIVIANNERILSAEDLKLSEQRYRLLFDGVQSGIIHFDLNGVILNCNSIFVDIIDTSKDKLIGLDMRTLPNMSLQEEIDKVLNGRNGYFKGEYTSVLSGKELYLEAAFNPIMDQGVLTSGVAVIKDLTKIIEIEKELEKSYNIDSITGFYNRKYYEETIITSKFDSLLPLQYGIVSIDNFQYYIDTIGYEKAEVILKQIGEHIKKCFPGIEYIYRISQTDFVIMIGKEINQNIDYGIEKLKIKLKTIKNVFPPLLLTSASEILSEGDIDWENVSNSLRSKISLLRKFSKSSINKNSISLLMASLFEKNKREKLHSDRVSSIAINIGLELNLSEIQMNQLRTASTLHDIGKINVENSILEKPGALTNEEYSKVKYHTVSGFRILSSVEEYKEIAIIVLSHHERWDGKGYPNQASGEDIPIISRIISVADTYDAIVSDRPYRKARNMEEAINELILNKGTQFDPIIVDAFVNVMKKTSIKNT